MNRRDFVVKSASGILGVGLTGCSVLRPKTFKIKGEGTPLELDKKVPKPKGTMPITELGKTGIKVSKFGFGSHMSQEFVPYVKEREWMVREALDLGVNFFDVYDYEFQIYQYEPMGRYLKDVINDVVISITMHPYDGRTIEEEIERDLRAFGRDYIDMVRIHAWRKDENYPSQMGHKWDWWEKLFKLKEKGYIRAVGVPVHTREDLKMLLAEIPLDFVIFPYNFYHNWLWGTLETDKKMQTIVPILRNKGIGVISMKPFAGDNLITPFKRLAAEYDESGEVNYAKACLRYVINSGINVDSTLAGMNNPYHLYENIDAFYNPQMSDQEGKVLENIRKKAKVVAKSLLPSHYQFLEEWVPDSWDDTDLFGTA